MVPPANGNYELGLYAKKGMTIIIYGKGTSIADCSPMLTVPSDHSYTEQVEIEIEGDAIGGLVLFYSEKISSGILADKENILANLRGWQFVTDKNVINNRVFLKLKNINNTVGMFYSVGGNDWIKIKNLFESTAFHYNVLSGFKSLRIGLC